ncbi:GumC family protein [Massilia varians]|uniref:GumC family protein n=1 Tax=Massilia varians TaxID=457921 RepID=UPI002553E63F|nr:GNVR domain-containing protein [Massilia varians]MDK6079271.1 GNVR domain-containing protein [Massilia varians]
MDQAQTTAPVSDDEFKVGETTLIDRLIVLAKYKKLIVALPVAFAVAAGAISLALPNVYKASAQLLPPQQAQSGAAALLSQLGGMAGAAAGAAGLKNNGDVYLGMLKSRTVADRIVGQFNLKKKYDTESHEEARLKLIANTTISSGKDGLILIEVQDKDQKLVAQMANAYVTELLRLTRILAVTEASQRRLFFERQLELSKNNLATAEVGLKRALDTHGVISVDIESRAIVETIGRLRALVSSKEIELNAMNAFVTASNPEHKRVVEELSSLRAELFKLENGRATAGTRTTASNEQGGFQNIKLLRDVKYYQMLYELLAKQYEVARLDEAKDSSIIQVLDEAIEPERHFKPKRAIIVVIAGLVGLLAAIIAAFVLDSRSKGRPSSVERWRELKSHLAFRNRKTDRSK